MEVFRMNVEKKDSKLPSGFSESCRRQLGTADWVDNRTYPSVYSGIQRNVLQRVTEDELTAIVPDSVGQRDFIAFLDQLELDITVIDMEHTRTHYSNFQLLRTIVGHNVDLWDDFLRFMQIRFPALIMGSIPLEAGVAIFRKFGTIHRIIGRAPDPNVPEEFDECPLVEKATRIGVEIEQAWSFIIGEKGVVSPKPRVISPVPMKVRTPKLMIPQPQAAVKKEEKPRPISVKYNTSQAMVTTIKAALGKTLAKCELVVPGYVPPDGPIYLEVLIDDFLVLSGAPPTCQLEFRTTPIPRKCLLDYASLLHTALGEAIAAFPIQAFPCTTIPAPWVTEGIFGTVCSILNSSNKNPAQWNGRIQHATHSLPLGGFMALAEPRSRATILPESEPAHTVLDLFRFLTSPAKLKTYVQRTDRIERGNLVINSRGKNYSFPITGGVLKDYEGGREQHISLPIVHRDLSLNLSTLRIEFSPQCRIVVGAIPADLVGGRGSISFHNCTGTLTLFRAGRPIAIDTSSRNETTPNVKTPLEVLASLLPAAEYETVCPLLQYFTGIHIAAEPGMPAVNAPVPALSATPYTSPFPGLPPSNPYGGAAFISGDEKVKPPLWDYMHNDIRVLVEHRIGGLAKALNELFAGKPAAFIAFNVVCDELDAKDMKDVPGNIFKAWFPE